MEFLQKTTKSLEDQLVLATDQTEEVVAQLEEERALNKRLRVELQAIDKLSHDLQREKEAAEAQGEKHLAQVCHRAERCGTGGTVPLLLSC